MKCIKLICYINVPAEMADEFVKGTPPQMWADLQAMMDKNYDVSFGEPELMAHYEEPSTKDEADEDIPASDGVTVLST